MGILDALIPGIGAISSIAGLFGAGNAAAAAARARQQMYTQAQQQINQQYNNQLQYNNQNIQSMAGQGGDAIMSLGRGMGADLANAGVYNSTGLAGALNQAQMNEQAGLSGAATQMQQNAWMNRQNALLNLTQQQLGPMQQDVNYYRGQYGNAMSGLAGYVGALGNVLGSQQSSERSQRPADGNPYDNGSGYYGPLVPGEANPMPVPVLGSTVTNQTSYAQPLTTNPSALNYGNYAIGPSDLTRSVHPMGLTSYLGAQSQHNLGISGANAYRPQLPMVNGTVNQGPNLAGNAGYTPLRPFRQIPSGGMMGTNVLGR